MDGQETEGCNVLDDADEVDTETLKLHLRALESEFGQKRAMFKDLFLQKEEELRQEHETLETTRKEKETLEEEMKRLQAELDESRSLVTIAECQKENEVETEKRKCQEEIASLQHIMKEAVVEATRAGTSRFEKEVAQLKKTNERLETELNELKLQQSGEREGVLAAVTKSLKQRVGGLSPHAFGVSMDSTESLEESMRKAQEDAEMLRSLVVPLEEEIKALKDKLRTTADELKMYETAFSGLVKGLGSESLSEMLKGKTPVEVIGHFDEKFYTLSQGLQAEKASRSDLEMYVAVLNTQKAVIQEDMDRLKTEFQEVCQLLEAEKREHASLKRTWQMANDQFLETQRLQIMDMRRMQSVLTPEQQRQIQEQQKKDTECMEQKQLLRLQQMKDMQEKQKNESLRSSQELSPPLSKFNWKSMSPLLQRKLFSSDSQSLDQPDSFSSVEKVRSAPEDLSLSGLEKPKLTIQIHNHIGDEVDSSPSEKRKLKRSLSSSALISLRLKEENDKLKSDSFAETRSLFAFDETISSPWSPKKLPSLTQDQLKALSDLTPEIEARKSLIENAKADFESISLVGKRLVSEKEWQLLEEELRRAREKLGQPCEMCRNYELQLQHVQKAEHEQKQQVIGLKQVLERYNEDLKREQAFRQDQEQQFATLTQQSQQESSTLFKKVEETEKMFADMKSTYVACCNELRDQLKQLTNQKEDFKVEVVKLQTENDALLGKHIAQAQQMQSEEISLPNSMEEMQFACLKLREELITAIAKAEHIENSLKSEILFLREQVMAEQNTKDTLEDTLTQELDSVKEQLVMLSTVKTDLDTERSRRSKLEQQMQATNAHMQQAQGKYQSAVSLLEKQVEELQSANSKQDEEIHHLRSKVQSLQLDLDNSEAVQRDFVKLSQSLQVELEKIRQSDSEVRWQHDDDVVECSVCKKTFHSNKEKNHCSHCGKIFCVDCCSKVVRSGPKQRPFKVCSVCHTLLDHDTAPYFSSEPPHTPS